MTARGPGRGVGGREEAVRRRVRAAEGLPGAEERPARVAAAGAPVEMILVGGPSTTAGDAVKKSGRASVTGRDRNRPPERGPEPAGGRVENRPPRTGSSTGTEYEPSGCRVLPSAS